MLLKSPLLKIVGTSKKDCAFIRNYGAKIGDIVQFEYNISNIYYSRKAVAAYADNYLKSK